MFKIVEAAFALTVLIGMQVPSDGHAPSRTFGRPGARVDHDQRPASHGRRN